MDLKEAILQCNQYEDTDEFMHLVFAKRLNDRFEIYSEATVLKLTLDEMEMNIADIQNFKCPGFDYFLEMSIIKDCYADIQKSVEYKSDDEKVKRIIYYAEFDA
ncbi:MAG: hypothetical protein K1X55_03815 [Chitinophagales bacterium]|nr:hypothetical protein [Chitinophagales bacterium]